jgi:hypothetical protein
MRQLLPGRVVDDSTKTQCVRRFQAMLEVHPMVFTSLIVSGIIFSSVTDAMRQPLPDCVADASNNILSVIEAGIIFSSCD